MATLLEMNGAGPQKQPRYAPIFEDRMFTGLFTQRSPLHDPADIYTAKYYGGRPDALWAGQNIELTNRLTLQRRCGLSAFSVSPFNYPTSPTRSYSFQLNDGTIRVIVDTQSTSSLVLTSVSNASAGTTVYHGTITGGGSNAYVGMKFLVAGFTLGVNNGTFVATASSGTTLTLANTAGVAATEAATAISSGAIYWDKLDGTTQLLYAKSPGAGQAYFIGSGGILYIGDGVDTIKYTPQNTNGTIWNWGIVAPTQPPTVNIVSSGSANTVWAKNSIFSTMGLTFDAYNNVWQLIDVDADNTNTPNAQFGTSGNGSPAWNNGLYQTTVETSGTPITWKNVGQLQQWGTGVIYGDAGVAGSAAPIGIYDPVTAAVYLNFNGGGGLSRSGTKQPTWTATPGWNFTETNGAGGTGYNQPHWFFAATFAQLKAWKPTTGYTAWYGLSLANLAANLIIEPFLLPPPTTGVNANTPVYMQVPTNTGTSGSSYAPFPNPAVNTAVGTGFQLPDAQLLWQCISTTNGATTSGLWQAATHYVPWTVPGSTFGCIEDSNGNMQVCISVSGTGQSGAVSPGTTISTGSYTVSNAVGNNTTITGTFTTAPVPGQALTFTGFTNAANNGTFTVVSYTTGTLVIQNQNGTAESHAATIVANAWGTTYGATTTDGGIVWSCVGPPVTWAATTAWNLPSTGFAPPQSSQAYGGSTIDASNGTVQTVIVSGESGPSTAPVWKLPTDNPNTVTEGPTSPPLKWLAESLASTNSLAWKLGLAYAYSYKARALDDFYSPPPLGGVGGVTQIPPGRDPATGGSGGALGAPLGSETNAVSSASPALVITGSNNGAVNFVSGVYSPDPQVDTIIIWRSADGGGSSQMFELTEIPNLPGNTGVWTFQDFLPSTPTNEFPGLNTEIPAPINGVNNPPFSTYLPMAYNFQRIWGADGQYVPFSAGPDIGVGNPDEAFAAADSLPFLAPVTRLVKTPQGLVTFLTDSIEVIAGGPSTGTFFSVTWAPGIGLLSYNALDVFTGEIYFFSSDNQFRVMTPSLNVTNAGFALGDQFANQPTSGVSDATWSPSKVYVASHQNGTDNCIMVADGSTGWYRLNARQAGAMPNPEPVWSPFASFVSTIGGCQMVQSVEVSPGIKKLLVGSHAQNEPLLFRDQTVFTDNGASYDAYFEMGNITLAHPGQLALLKFVEFDFSGVGFKPTISYLLNEISGAFVPFTLNPVFDPPSLYGDTITPGSYSPNRYYFSGTASLARCRHLRLKVDYGTTAVGNELYTATIFGRLMIEV